MKHGNHNDAHSAGKPHGKSGHAGDGVDRHLHNPIADKLIPLEPLDLSKVKSIDDLVRAMSKTAFTGRQLGEAADVLETMANAGNDLKQIVSAVMNDVDASTRFFAHKVSVQDVRAILDAWRSETGASVGEDSPSVS